MRKQPNKKILNLIAIQSTNFLSLRFSSLVNLLITHMARTISVIPKIHLYCSFLFILWKPLLLIKKIWGSSTFIKYIIWDSYKRKKNIRKFRRDNKKWQWEGKIFVNFFLLFCCSQWEH